MKDSTQTKILIITAIVGFLLILFSIKFFGASEIPSLVEKDGFCKMTYGEDFNFSEKNLDCYSKSNFKLRYNFTEQEFRNSCPKVNFFELKVYSDCFHLGER
jgi:hypothetical protein